MCYGRRKQQGQRSCGWNKPALLEEELECCYGVKRKRWDEEEDVREMGKARPHGV